VIADEAQAAATRARETESDEKVDIPDKISAVEERRRMQAAKEAFDVAMDEFNRVTTALQVPLLSLPPSICVCESDTHDSDCQGNARSQANGSW
jgi:hypothetical protein